MLPGPCRPDSPSPLSPSLAYDHGELEDFSPKGHEAPGTMSVTLPFGCEGHICGAPPGSGAEASLCCTTFQKDDQAPQPLSPH